MKQRVERVIAQIVKLKPLELSSALTEDFKEVCQYLDDELNHFFNSLPIINALQEKGERGANQLIPILNESSQETLLAFDHLTQGHQLNALVKTFLIKNTAELKTVNRNSLIEFLRRPDLSGELSRFLESKEGWISTVMSVRFLVDLLDSDLKKCDRINRLRTLLADYPFPIANNILWALVDSFNMDLQTDLSSEISGTFILLFYELLARMSCSSQICFINGLNKDTFLLILEHCLKRSGNEPKCNELLCIIVSINEELSPNLIDLMKYRLNQRDSYLFESESQETLAKELLTQHEESVDLGARTTWVEHLLTSPSFIAASTPKVINNLGDRYKLISLLMNKTDLNHIKDQNPLWSQINDSFAHINKVTQIHPEAKDTLIVKKLKLKRFIVETGLPALLNLLENECKRCAKYDELTAIKAMMVLYNYYQNTISCLRSDLFFQSVDYAYQEEQQRTPDFKKSVLLSWFKQYAPDFPVDPLMLQRKKEVTLHNSEGQIIAYLNEANEAVSFVNDEAVLLVQTGSIQLDDFVYDQHRAPMGRIANSGQLTNVNLSLKNASAQLLAKVPNKELKRSKKGLELLIRNVLFENSIDELYHIDEASNEHSKKLWLERYLTKSIKNERSAIAEPTLYAIAAQHSEQLVFTLLATINNKTNALHLFHGILHHDTKREELFSGVYESDFHRFLKNHNVVDCFAEYLIRYYDRTWFTRGLEQFANYAKKFQIENLLSATLTLLASRPDIDPELLDAVLKSLIGSESTARIVLEDLLNDTLQSAVQAANNPEIDRISIYFYKQHLVNTLHKLNKISYWEDSAQYRLMLHLLHAQKAVLFATNQTWETHELAEFGYFISRHLSKKRPFDYQSTIGHSILGELIFRSAQQGQISMFYHNKKFNPSVAGLFFTRLFLVQLIDKFWIPAEIKDQFEHPEARFIACFDEQLPVHRDLKSNQILSDWCILVNQTWNKTNNGKLPAISTLILNYSGHKKPLNILLSHYVHHFQNKPDYLYPVTALMRSFPNRDFSGVLFDFFEATLIKHPHLLDRTILSHMAHFYAIIINKKEAKSIEAELDLLIYFGQNKHYLLAQAGCDILSKDCDNKALKKKLIKGSVEAKVEGELSAKLDRFYFGLIKTFKRLFNYGFNAQKHSSKIIKFCDEEISQPPRKPANKHITIPRLEEQQNNIHLGFVEKRKQFISLLAAIKGAPRQPKTSQAVISASRLRFYKSEPKSVTIGFSTASNKTVGAI